MAPRVNAELVQLGDIDELIRHLDRLCAADDWDGVVEVRALSLAALERGHQLWPVAAHAEYRLALDGPGPHAAATLVAGAGRFALGPMPEVAAARHTWEELAPHATAGPTAALAAHERVIRGEDLTGDGRVLPGVLDVPLVLQPWEPRYPLAEYQPHEAAFPEPAAEAVGDLERVDLPHRGGESSGDYAARAEPDADAESALLDLVATWTQESNGHAEVRCVRGEATDAIAAFGLTHARVAPIDPALGLAIMAWTGASGGAHGRRRGMAPGRFAAWWAAAALAGLLDDWPPSPESLGEAVAELRWWVWDPGAPDTGWSCRIAVDDPVDGLAWALTAVDART